MMAQDLAYIKGVTFGFMTKRGKFADKNAQDSMQKMVDATGADNVILAVTAKQQTAHSEEIDFKSEDTPGDDEIVKMIQYAKNLGLRVILKPMVNCEDGTWRAHINFFDIEVPCEPKWSKWFESYTEFMLHYAKIAMENECEMLIIGCELVQTQRRETEWRALIKKIREVYTGLITYNTDKYQEGEVAWWDALDVISSSGYYPINDWGQQLERIRKVVERFNKPFFFAEAGCMSSKGSSYVPNDWTLGGKRSLEEQRSYYEVMFDECEKQSWIRGFGIWDWNAELYPIEWGAKDPYYALYGKPACEIVKSFYTKK